MYLALSIIIVVASILLTAIVLVQNSKGGGLAANFTSGNQTFGVRQTADFLEKATWTLAAIILILAVVAQFFTNAGYETKSNVKEKIENTTTTQPQFPANPTGAPEAVPSSAPAAGQTAPASAPSTTPGK